MERDTEKAGEPSDYNTSLTLREVDREGRLMGVVWQGHWGIQNWMLKESVILRNGSTLAGLPSAVTGWGQPWEASPLCKCGSEFQSAAVWPSSLNVPVVGGCQGFCHMKVEEKCIFGEVLSSPISTYSAIAQYQKTCFPIPYTMSKPVVIFVESQEPLRIWWNLCILKKMHSSSS